MGLFKEKINAVGDGYNRQVENIRKTEYPQIKDVAYLDHSGTTLCCSSLISSFQEDVTKNLFGNPHSQNPSSRLSSIRIEATRLRVLELFRADPAEFDVIFVANATAAIKLVADAFSNQPVGFSYRYHNEVHTSMIGVRQLASSGYCFDSDAEVEEWLSESRYTNGTYDGRIHGLFAWPGQSNFSGRRLPKDWPEKLRRSRPGYYSLLDAAALVMTAPLDLSDSFKAPDFTAMSFYKMFGFPNLGALIVRRASAKVLSSRLYFGGGTVSALLAGEIYHQLKTDAGDHPHDSLEDGTCAFHSIIALDHAIAHHRRIFGSFEDICRHTTSLAILLESQLANLRHPSTGLPLLDLYADHSHADPNLQGPVFTFNLRKETGEWIGYTSVEALAGANKIHVRAGGHCNAGGVQRYCGMAPDEMRQNFIDGHICGDGQDVINGKPTGAIRVSLGAMTTANDVMKFVNFLREEYIRKPKEKTMSLSSSTTKGRESNKTQKHQSTKRVLSKFAACFTGDPMDV